MKIMSLFILSLIAPVFSFAGICGPTDATLFETYIQKRQEHKLALIAFRANVLITGVRIEKEGRRESTHKGQYKGTRVYSHRQGAEYINGKYSGDKMFKSAPLFSPGPIKIFVEQDEDSNGPLQTHNPNELSKINLKNYKLMGCEMNAPDQDGRLVHRFTIAPRVEREGFFEGYLDVDRQTLLTLAEVSTRTILSDKAKGNLGGRMTEFNFARLFKIHDDRVTIPYLFKTHGKSRWSWYTDVKIEARFDLIDYKLGDR